MQRLQTLALVAVVATLSFTAGALLTLQVVGEIQRLVDAMIRLIALAGLAILLLVFLLGAHISKEVKQ